MAFLYSIFDNPFARRALSQINLPYYMPESLRHKMRSYQEEAFRRFIYLLTEDFEEKPKRPFHLLYNMATGSGKTYVMAGLMLYLYERGYRNFLFFVNSNNIIQKTKENFLNAASSKYLFNDKIIINGGEIFLRETPTFESADEANINLHFTTIQQLHIDLNDAKENSLTYEDFQDKKIVLIADEAHHLNAATRNNGELFGSWEGTVLEILKANHDNILLEFTATLDYESREISEKYQDKALMRYDLSQFRNEKYSKEISLIRSFYDEKERIIQALLLNLYREEIAAARNINLKPVILFKAKRTIAESENNKEIFHKLIEDLNAGMIQNVKKTSTVPVIQKAFSYFLKAGITNSEIVNRLKANFKIENCISANNDAEAALNQIRLNTLEDANNPIRAIFAVQKLNEGWDVLNLYDIVRLYEGRDGRGGHPGRTTISEAQLIGRGARYFPFALQADQDSYTRKFDHDLSNDLRILEELYYHTKEDSQYVYELKQALIDTGLYEDDENLITRQLTLKDSFKKTDFYKGAFVFFNTRVKADYRNIRSFKDLGVKRTNFIHVLSSGFGKKTGAFDVLEQVHAEELQKGRDIKVSDFPVHVIRYAISQRPFYNFKRLNLLFPKIQSTTEFIENEAFLGGLEVTIKGTAQRLAQITNHDYLATIGGLLDTIESEIKSVITEYTSSEFTHDLLRHIFSDKEIRVHKLSERADGQEALVANENWYAYNANFGTSEEKSFISMFARRAQILETKYDNIFVIRNERTLKIYDRVGRAFEPDFLLFCQEKQGNHLSYQVFIEPKGAHLTQHDKWKEDFLLELREKKQLIQIHTDNYKITGVPFYNNSNENEFVKAMESALEN